MLTKVSPATIPALETADEEEEEGAYGNANAQLLELVILADSPDCPHVSMRAADGHYHTGDLWFTDARYAYWQYFAPEPSIRPQVYRFEPKTGVVQAVADYFIAPNGIEFSPDFKHVYVTDTGVHTFPGKDNYTAPATVYRFDITSDGKRLENRLTSSNTGSFYLFLP